MPLELHLGSSWTSFGQPLGVQEASKTVQQGSRRPPRTPHDASKSAPQAPGSPPLADQTFFVSERPPRGLQEASRASLGPLRASPRLLQQPPRPPERSPRAPQRDLPDASPSKPRSMQDLSRCFQALLGQAPSIHHPRPGGMREAIK